MTEYADIEQVLSEHVERLQGCLLHVLGDSSGLEDGSDAYLLLQALLGRDGDVLLVERLEQSGRGVAEYGGTLDGRFSSLQRYIDSLS